MDSQDRSRVPTTRTTPGQQYSRDQAYQDDPQDLDDLQDVEDDYQDGEADDYSDYSTISDEPPIIYAAARGDYQMLQQILTSPEKEVEMHRKSREGKAPALFAAAFRAEIDCIKLLLAHGADINETDSHNRTPLFVAAYNGSLACVQELISQGADLTIKDNDDTTTLHVGVASGNTALVEYLLAPERWEESGPLIQTCDKIGRTALHFAVSEGHQEIAQLLIQKGAALDIQAADCKTALHMAAERGYHSLLELLLYEGADVEVQSDTGCTALHLAASNGHASCVALLLSYGSRVDAADLNGNTALHYACFYSHLECVQVLLSRKANSSSLTDAVGRTALDVACNSGAVFCCQELLACDDVDINHRDLYGRTPLFRAAILSEACTQLLIERNADVLALDNMGRNALHYAAYFGRAECANMLLLASQKFLDSLETSNVETVGKNPLFIADKGGQTPVHAAACTGSSEVLRLFLENGAEMEAADDKGRTAWHYVSKNGDLRSARLLLGAGVNPNLPDKKDGQSALHVASLRGHLEVVQLLLTLAPLPNKIGDNRIRTPLHYAAASGNVSIIEEIINSAASRVGIFNSRDSLGRLPIHSAALNGHEAVTRILLDLSLDDDENDEEDYEEENHHPNYNNIDQISGDVGTDGHNTSKGAQATDKKGRSPLHLAAASGKETSGGVIELLLSRAPTTATALDIYKRTPIHMAAYFGRLDNLRRLLPIAQRLEASTDVGDLDGRSPLFHASRHGHSEVVKFLLDYGHDPNRVDVDGRSSLHAAVNSGHLEASKLLLQRAANVNLAAKNLETPLHLAATSTSDNAEESVAILLTLGANPLSQDRYGRIPLHWAAHSGNARALRSMLQIKESGSLVSAKDKEGRTGLDHAAFKGHTQCVSLLLENGADPLVRDDKTQRLPIHAAAYAGSWLTCSVLISAAPESVRAIDVNGSSALHRAAWRGHLNCVAGLIEKGALIDLKDVDGITPLMMAIKSKRKKIVGYLKKLCSKINEQNGKDLTVLDGDREKQKQSKEDSPSIVHNDKSRQQTPILTNNHPAPASVAIVGLSIVACLISVS